MPELLVGPLLRWVSESEATVWVETDAACEVEVLGHVSPTFHVEGHHYAIVAIGGLSAGTSYPYQVSLDGTVRWPIPDSGFPASVIRTLDPSETVRLVFGSCRLSVPHEPPFTTDRLIDRQGRGPDALAAYARRLIDSPGAPWPQVLMLTGDQVYADDVPEATREFIAQRRDTSRPPHESVADFLEYTHLYRISWSEPLTRWLFSTVSTSMIFDDHDVIDDWNISAEWVADMRREAWWDDRIVGAFMSYWIYQHLGNLSVTELAADPVLRAVREAVDGGPILRRFAFMADRETAGSRWAYRRDLGSARLVVVDSRAARVLQDGQREMIDEAEWRWVEENVTGDVDHLVIASSLPVLLVPGMHHVQAWSERVAAGAWGGVAARLAERVRRGFDLEHWAAFGTSFERLFQLISEIGAGRSGRAPSSIVFVSGDVHHGYLARVAFRRRTGVRSAVYQAVSSPLRNPLGKGERMGQRIIASRLGGALTRLLARSAGVPSPIVRWKRLEGLVFDNQIATLELHGRNALLRAERSVPSDAPERAALETIWERRLAPAPADAASMTVDSDGRPAAEVDPKAGAVR
ncbi:MAG: alkaline phosphatase family protein [Chloroflexi bacterium]|nr:alkaline phosphatase family protein [Chloroflexota bacterium]